SSRICARRSRSAPLRATGAAMARLTGSDHIALVEQASAHNYRPLPVVIASGEGVWVTDVDGNKYMDMLAAYSALNFGHRHPALIAAATAQLGRVTLTS